MKAFVLVVLITSGHTAPNQSLRVSPNSVTMQEFSSQETCNKVKAEVEGLGGSVTAMCYPK